MADDFLGQAREILARVLRRKLCNEAAFRTLRHGIDDFGAQQVGGAILDFRELWADAGFERKTSQQSRTERVDRLDLQPARRLDGSGKQGPRRCQTRRVDRCVDTKLGERAGQCGILQHRPVSQTLEQAVLHLRGGRLGISQTEDVLRLNAVEEKARNPVGQNTGFSRACVRGKPG